MKKIIFILFLILIIILGGLFWLKKYRVDKCSDGICQRWEQKRGNCSIDCKKEEFPIKPIVSKESNIKKFSVLFNSGGRVFWVESEKLIYFDKKGRDGYVDVYVANEDGSNEKCLTCDKSGIYQENNGFPQVHPNNKYILFQSENTNLKKIPSFPKIQKFVGNPGVGINNDLWIMDKKAEKFWKLTNVSDLHGTLHPYFSEDGRKLVWSELREPISGVGNWVVKVGDFEIINDTPKLSNIKTIDILGEGLYETQTFTRDGKKVFVSFAPKGTYYYEMEEYLIDINTLESIKLTNNNAWDEQAKITVDGKIIYVSSEENSRPNVKGLQDVINTPPEIDFWIMDIDGSNKKRLTYFNDLNSIDYIKSDGGIGIGEFAINNDGKIVIGKMRKDRKDQIVKIEFNINSFMK